MPKPQQKPVQEVILEPIFPLETLAAMYLGKGLEPRPVWVELWNKKVCVNSPASFSQRPNMAFLVDSGDIDSGFIDDLWAHLEAARPELFEVHHESV